MISIASTSRVRRDREIVMREARDGYRERHRRAQVALVANYLRGCRRNAAPYRSSPGASARRFNAG
jgi:hypothetical protein